MWVTTGLNNESDVEQKFLYQFLTEQRPLGLGLPPEVIQSKTNIRRLTIGKGSDQKSYFPDYLVVNMGFPLVVVEAKSPGDRLDDGFREARLYATEINALFGHGIAPAQFVIASNGVELWYGYADQAQPLGVAQCCSLGAYSPDVANLLELVGWEPLKAKSKELAHRTRANELFKPRRLLGGLAFQNEEVGQNSFGATLTTAISAIFNPTSSDERANVARNAYVPSKRRERYVDPIDRVIRAARPPSEQHASELEDSSQPRELIGRLKDAGVVPNARVTVEANDHGGVMIVIPGHEQVELPHHMAHAVRVEKV